MFPKLSRLESQANLDLMRTFACQVCGVTPVDVHHLKTKGSGGGDELWNLASLCRKHHSEAHAMGVKTFWKKIRPSHQLFQRTEETSSGEIVARIQELKGRQDRIREQLNKANKVLIEAKDARDNLLLAMYAVDRQIEDLEQGQLPMFGDEIDDE